MDSTENQPADLPADTPAASPAVPPAAEPPPPAGPAPDPVVAPPAIPASAPGWNPALGPEDPWEAPGAWMAAQPARQRSKVLVGALAAAAVLALGCLGAVGWGILRIAGTVQPAAGASARPIAPAFPAGVATPEPSGSVTGPQASSYPVRETDDLQRLCEGWYYPKSPKLSAKGLNPVQVFANERKDLPSLIQKTVTGVPYTASKAVQDAYDPASPAKVRQVACLDLTSTGKYVRTCKFDDPKPDKLALRQGFYRFALYEVATGKKLVDKRVTGEDDACPYVVLLGSDRTIYSAVGDRQLYELLRKYVQK